MTLQEWGRYHGHHAKAARVISDRDGTKVKRGDVGDICDVDFADGYVIVDFPSTGPIACFPDEIRPALSIR